MIISIIASILMIVSIWKIFQKAGQPGWASIIPIYNMIVLFKICWKQSMLAAYLILSFVYGLIFGLAEGDAIDMESPLVVIVLLAVVIAMLVMSIKLYINFAKSFGKSAGFGIGLVFLPVIFFPMLAFGSAQYLGNPSTGAMYVPNVQQPNPYGQQQMPYAQNNYNPYDPTNTYGQNGYNQNGNTPYNPYYQQQNNFNQNDVNQNGNNPYNNNGF